MGDWKSKIETKIEELQRTCGLTITDSLGADITDAVVDSILEVVEGEIQKRDKLAFDRTQKLINRYNDEILGLKKKLEGLFLKEEVGEG